MKQRLKALSKPKKILLAVIAALLCAAIITGGLIWKERSDYFCQYATPFAFRDIKGHEGVELVAHRGQAIEAPENTLPAYEKAAANGYKYAETDIRATADGVWVLSHDASLKRMTGFSGIVEQLPLKEVTAHPITKGGNIKAYQDNPLYTPTYEDFIKLCKQKGLHPVIEIKTEPAKYPQAPYKDIITVLERYDMVKQAVVISFSYEALEIIRGYHAKIALQYLTKTMDAAVFEKIEKLGGCGIDCEYKALLKNKDLVALAKHAFIPINAWTVDSPQAAEQLCALGVDYITTNAGKF